MNKFFSVRPDTDVYAFPEELVQRINMAIALRRPLLLTGGAGVGKSTVANGVAHGEDWVLLQKTVSSRAEAIDLKAEFDAVGRLSDATANAERARNPRNYVSPGVLWRGFDPAGAAAFLAEVGKAPDAELDRVCAAKGRVILIDEIDKGDLDFANDLLDVFDAGGFDLPVLGDRVMRDDTGRILVVITSNGERDLSPAFQRRCVPYQVAAPHPSRALAIGQAFLRREEKAGSLTDEQLLKLATVAAHSNELNPALFVDLIAATLAFAPEEAEWTDFSNGLENFAQARRAAVSGQS